MLTVLGTVLSFIFTLFFFFLDDEIIELEVHHNDSDFAVLLQRGTFDYCLMLKLFYSVGI